MGNPFASAKPKGPSQAELNARAAEQKKLQQQEEQARLEEDRSRNKRIAQAKSIRNRSTGRQSLIATSELGTKSTLG